MNEGNEEENVDFPIHLNRNAEIMLNSGDKLVFSYLKFARNLYWLHRDGIPVRASCTTVDWYSAAWWAMDEECRKRYDIRDFMDAVSPITMTQMMNSFNDLLSKKGGWSHLSDESDKQDS